MNSNCPSCGAQVFFKSSVSVFAVCDHCKSMLVRHDMDLENLGRMATIPDDVSPLKIGSRGIYDGTPFAVIGRLKVAWSEGFWNEWYLQFLDGRQGWLGEALGFYMLSFEAKDTGKVPTAASLSVGGKHQLLPGQTYAVDDIKDAVCVASEGELPFPGLQGRKTTSVDLSDTWGKYACIEYSPTEGVRLFLGKYVTFADLRFTELRDLSADLKRVRSTELFKCPSCGGPVSLLAPGHTAAVVCGYCGSTIDATNRNLKILSKANKQMKIKPLIPIGTKGLLAGGEWEAVGFMRRTDGSGLYSWDEYLLFNPFLGFRWLMTENGHWTFLEMIRARPERHDSGMEMRLGEETFKCFLKGKAKVAYVLGEFYWRVKTGDIVSVEDYTAPPRILCCERDKTEAIWSLGRYLEPREVANAFGVAATMEPAAGVAPSQPSPYEHKASAALQVFAGLLFLLTVLQFYFIVRAANQVVYEEKFLFKPTERTASFTTPTFELPGGATNLEVALQSPVQNDWMDAEIDLVDDERHSSMEFEQGVEYYSGWDSDGSWTEGNQRSDLVFSSLPGGRYHFVVQPVTSGVGFEKNFTLTVRRDIVIWSNYFVALLLLAPYPLYLVWRRRAFEVARWADSDYSPYRTEEGA